MQEGAAGNNSANRQTRKSEFVYDTRGRYRDAAVTRYGTRRYELDRVLVWDASLGGGSANGNRRFSV